MKLRHCLLALMVVSLLAQVPAAASPTGTSLSGFGDDDDDDDDRDDDDGDDDSSDANEAVDELLSDINDGYDAYQKAEDLMDQWESLDAREADCGSNYSADAGPTVPSQCAESEDCMRCYGDAVRAIDFNRFYIERARCITAANVRMANSAMAFGDSSSGVHGVMGLSWSLGGKPQIEQAVADLKRTYTRKANDYLFEIDRSMKKLGQCEAEHFGERDWYQRYGWLYVNFMRSKYGTAPE